MKAEGASTQFWECCPVLYSTADWSPLGLQTVLEQGGSFAGINRKVQIKPLKWSQPQEGSKTEPRVTEALLILKHGGVLTHAGRQQVCCSLLSP